MSGIRVTYSGLISFGLGFFSLISGLIFTIIFTRSLTAEEFGTWGIMGTLIGYVIMLNPLVGYWVTREISRGEESGRTALYASFFLTAIAVIIYLAIAVFFGSQVEIDTFLLIAAAMIIPAQFIQSTLIHISLSHKPHLVEIGLMVFEISKVPLALGFVYYLDMGLNGAIITVATSYTISAIFLSIKNRDQLRSHYNKKFIKKWLKLFWIPSYPKISAIFTRSEIAMFTLITGSVSAVAYWSAANAISQMVKHSAKINNAIYPKLLSGGKKEFFQENLLRVMYFTFPLSAMTIVFAKPGLFVLNPIYAETEFLVQILVPLFFLRVLNAIFNQALSGIENVDTNENATFRDYVKSKLIYLPTLENIHRGLYLLCLIIVLLIVTDTSTDSQLLMYWAIVAVSAQLPFTVYLLLWIRREFSPQINGKIILKYFISSILVFGGIDIILENYLEYDEEIFVFLPNLIPYLLAGGLGYVGLTYLIDNKTKNLVKSIFNEIRKR